MFTEWKDLIEKKNNGFENGDMDFISREMWNSII